MITMSTFGKNGQLGNQLFQYASMIGLAHKHDQILVLPKWKYANYFNGFPLVHTERAGNPVEVKEKAFHYTEYNEVDFSRNIDFKGYFQSQKYWAHCEEKVLEALEFKESFRNDVYIKHKHLLVERETIAIHVRRGDFVDNPAHNTLPINYFINALFIIPSWELHNILIFSDDVAWCRFHFGGIKNVHFPNGNEIEDLCLMSMCNKFILSNSTFGWWAAYLSDRSYHSLVIRPLQHFGTLGHSLKDYYFENWIALDNQKVNLEDVTFMIPFHFDSNDRIQNLDLTVKMIQKYFVTRIIIAEQGNNKAENINGTWYLKIESINSFHRTKIINRMAEVTKTDIIVNWDADVFCSPVQIFLAVQRIREKVSDVVYPYDRGFAHVPRQLYPALKKSMDIGNFKLSKFKGMTPGDRSYHSVGGAVVFRKSVFLEGGGENENMIGYSPEDVERFERFTKLGYRIDRIPGVLYHLDHYKGPNSKCHGNPHDKQNHEELEKIKSMSKEELQKYDTRRN